jgi:hypothetical protein
VIDHLQIAAIVAALIGMATWCAMHAVVRGPSSFAAGRRQMFEGVGPSTFRRPDEMLDDVVSSRVGRALVGRFGNGLELAGLTPTAVVTRVLGGSVVVGFTTLVGVGSLGVVELLPASPVLLVLPLLTAALAGFTMLADTRSRVERAQRELRAASNDFVQLVAVGLTTDQSVEDAIRFALGVGSGGAFEVLRQAIATAPLRGVPVWEAIDELGARHDVRELCEFATSVERQGLHGVSIASTVATLAASMRAKSLDALEREADKANANLSGPTIGFVMATIVFLAYPLAQRISDAFGG